MIDAFALHELAHGLHEAGWQRAARLVSGLGRVVFSAHIAPEATIGAGTEFGYGGLGVVIHRRAVLGHNVLVSPGVVIGGRSGLAGAPVIEDDVKIGAGAKILGPIRIGRGARIGANAVVLHDVAAGETVAGVPAHPLHAAGPTAA